MRLFSSHIWVMPSLVPSRPFTLRSKVMSVTSELDLDVDTGRQVESHQRVDRLRRGVDDVDEALVGAHLEVLAGVLVLVGRADDAVHVLPRRGVDHLVVIGLEPDADLLSRHRSLSSLVSSVPALASRNRVPSFLDLAPGEALPPCSTTRCSTFRPTPAVGRVAGTGRTTRDRGPATCWCHSTGSSSGSGLLPCTDAEPVRPHAKPPKPHKETRFSSQG